MSGPRWGKGNEQQTESWKLKTASHEILLYYRYVRIVDPELYAEEQRALCAGLGLLGRIQVAGEGINGTVSGVREATQEYIATMHSDPRTADMAFKIDPAEGHAFEKLSVKARAEIVALNLGSEDLDPNAISGERLGPDEFLDAMQRMEMDGAILLDGRNKYETDLGRFKGAVCPDVEHFREFPQWIRENLGDAKDRPILTYCTGGIRCEKLSGFLRREGFSCVAQLEGGIVNYAKAAETRGQDFEGQCYVFDSRIGVPVNSVNPVVVARCLDCGEPCERYRNCAWELCNGRIFLCSSCEKTRGRFCSSRCRTAESEAKT